MFLNARHPIVQTALVARALDPVLLGLLASASYTAVNATLDEITDAHEALFLAAHAAHLAAIVAG